MRERVVWAAFWSVKAGMLWLVGFDKRSIAPVIDTFGPGRHEFLSSVQNQGNDRVFLQFQCRTG